MSIPPRPLVSIIILTFNQLAFTRLCVDSIRRHTPESHEIVFVDNGSNDGTVEWLRELAVRNPHYSLISNGENLGYAKGNNQGIDAARGEYLLLLNNDVVVSPQWLSGLLDCYSGDEPVGIVGPVTNSISGMQQLPQVGYRELAGLDSFAAAHRSVYRNVRVPQRRIVGFCMLFPRSLVERAGTLDERYGTGNYEDDDFCLRAAIEGFTNLVAVDVFVHHFGSATFRGNLIDHTATMGANRSLFRQKWSQPIEDAAYERKVALLKLREKVEAHFCQERPVAEGVAGLVSLAGLADRDLRYSLTKWCLSARCEREAFRILELMPPGERDGCWYSLLGWCALRMGRDGEAAALGEEALCRNPHDGRALALLGELAAAGGNSVEAERLFRRTCESAPSWGYPHGALGRLASSRGDVDAAFLHFEKGAGLSPLEGDVVGRYVAAAIALGQGERAVKRLGMIRHFYPDSLGVCRHWIALLMACGKGHEALGTVMEGVGRFGADPWLLEKGGEARRVVGPKSISPQRAHPTVSLCMIVKNEEANLPRVLTSLDPIVDEIVVVDTGSTDRSREIAALYGAKVFEHTWQNDFSEARNLSLSYAAGDWILVMDADEAISPLDHSRFRELLGDSRSGNKAYEVVTRNYTIKSSIENWSRNDGSYAAAEAGAGWTPSNKVRLFPNNCGIRFANRVHEMVEDSIARLGISIVRSDIPVHHYGYLDTDRQENKWRAYYELGMQKLATGELDVKSLYELAVQAAELKRFDEAKALWHRVIALSPDWSVAYFNLGYVCLQMGLFGESLAATRRALELRPDYPEAIVNLAIGELCTGDLLAAGLRVETALESSSELAGLQVLRAVVCCCDGNLTEGVEYFRGLRARGVMITGFLNEMIGRLGEAGKTEWVCALLRGAATSGCVDTDTVRLVRKYAEN
jgi:GT2 family glycosyltransferase/Flp pilus assembly protein TadD